MRLEEQDRNAQDPASTRPAVTGPHRPTGVTVPRPQLFLSPPIVLGDLWGCFLPARKSPEDGTHQGRDGQTAGDVAMVTRPAGAGPGFKLTTTPQAQGPLPLSGTAAARRWWQLTPPSLGPRA